MALVQGGASNAGGGGQGGSAPDPMIQAAIAAAKLPPKQECSRCGSLVSKNDSRTVCSTCILIQQSEIDGLRNKLGEAQGIIDQLNAQIGLKDGVISQMQRETHALEQAGEQDGLEKLNLKAKAIRMTMSIKAWQAYRDHVKVSQKCIPCKTGNWCPEIEHLEKNAESETPKIQCNGCDERDKEILIHRVVSEELNKIRQHIGRCSQCHQAMKGRCWTASELESNIYGKISEARSKEFGHALIRRLFNSVHDFSNLGDGSALIYNGGTYRFVKLSLDKIPMDAVQHLSSGSTPGDALPKQGASAAFASPSEL